MSARRSQVEKIMDVLRAISDGAETPTRICYRANLSWTALQTVLNRLIQVKFVVEEGSGKRKILKLTREGYLALKQVEEGLAALNPVIMFDENAEPHRLLVID